MKTFDEYILHLESHGSRPALVDDASATTMTYAQLVAKAQQVAAQLLARGLQPGDRMLIYKVRQIDWVPLFLGAQLAGIIVVPVDNRLSLEMVQATITQTTPKLVVCSDGTDLNHQVVDASKLITGRPHRQSLPQSPQDEPRIAEILLTSGTWSKPKGVTLTQANLLSNLSATLRCYELEPDEVFLSILPLAHAYEQMCGLLMPLYAGAQIVYIADINGPALKAALKKYRVTMLVAVPRILELLRKGILAKVPKHHQPRFGSVVRAARHAPLPLRRAIFGKVHRELAPQLRALVIGGAPYDLTIDKFFRGLGYQTLLGYGLSETSPIISICTRPGTRLAGSVGRPIDTATIKINHEGEILIQAPSVFRGYWPAEHTEEWFNTGDQGYLHANGDLVLTGRTKNLIIYSNGDKLFLEDIEQLANSIEGVEESCVLYASELFKGSFDVALRMKEGFDGPAIKARLLVDLPAIARIGQVINIYPSELPRTHTLKLNRGLVWRQFGKSLDS